MKKRRLKKWVKVLLTILSIIVSAIICFKIPYFWKLAQSNIKYQVIYILSCYWAIIGQIMVYSMLWRN